jgi:hypothetical protein
MHRVREAMRMGTFEKMAGEVEADETFIGGKERNKHGNIGRQLNNTRMIQRGKKGKTRVRAMSFPLGAGAHFCRCCSTPCTAIQSSTPTLRARTTTRRAGVATRS